MRTERKDKDYFPELPPVEAGGHLIGYLWEIGPMIPAGMGLGPITQGEIQAWQANTGIDLQPWEARFLRRLSGEYLAELHAAEKPERQAPWSDDGQTSFAIVASDLKQTIRRMTNL